MTQETHPLSPPPLVAVGRIHLANHVRLGRGASPPPSEAGWHRPLASGVIERLRMEARRAGLRDGRI